MPSSMRNHNTTYTLFRFISISILLSVCFSLKTIAQQVSMTDQYYINPSLYNPAAVGYNSVLEAYILRNNKFKDFDGGQTLHALTIGKGFKDGKYGIGLNLMNNSIDIFNTTQIDFSYSYRVKLDYKQFLRLGLSAGFSDFRLNASKKNADMHDELLQKSHYNNTEFVAHIGAQYTNRNLMIAIAVPQLINQSNLSKFDGEDLYRQSRHYLLAGSYEIPVRSIKDLSFIPNFMMRFVKNTPLQYDINAQLKLKNKGWFSLNYRNKYAIGLNIGVNASKNLKVGYAYNVNTQNSAHISATNHEFLIGYTFRKSAHKKQNHKSQELIFLKDLLEDKYNRINQLEEELKKYIEATKTSSQKDAVSQKKTTPPNTKATKPENKPIETKKTKMKEQPAVLPKKATKQAGVPKVKQKESNRNTKNSGLIQADKKSKFQTIKSGKKTQNQTNYKNKLSAKPKFLPKNKKASLNSDALTFVDINVVYDKKRVTPSTNPLKNTFKKRTLNNRTNKSLSHTKQRKKEDVKIFSNNNITLSEEPDSAPDNTYTLHKVGQIKLDKNLENLFFAFGKSDLSSISKQKADKIASLMTKNNNYILKLYAFSDDTKFASLNSALSNKRLGAVYSYLTQNQNLEGRIVIIPNEEDNAIKANTQSKSRAFNRRVYMELYAYD